MQTVDYTTLAAICADLRQHWIPARVENAYQRDRHTVALALRTLNRRGWLTLAWHPQAARICMDDPPPRAPDTFTFSQQLRHQLGGLALVAVEPIAPWERAINLQFAQRPGDRPLWHLYVEIMGKYSNVILTNQHQQIVTAAHQVGEKQSSVRSIQTSQPYEPPPALSEAMPSLQEPFERWQERVSLVPGKLWKNLLKTYRGVSPVLARQLCNQAQLDPDTSTEDLQTNGWESLHQVWQEWLQKLATEQFQPGWTASGYTVTGWGLTKPVDSVQTLLKTYYNRELLQQEFTQLRHQLMQKIDGLLAKLRRKASDFGDRLQQSEQADDYRQQADLLMAYLHQWQPGMTEICLPAFETGEDVCIPLSPTKNAVQNAQSLYKRHQKMRRSRESLLPLLQNVQTEIEYLEQIEAAIAQISAYQDASDLETLIEIREELMQQGYWGEGQQRQPSTASATAYHRYRSPGGFEVWIGRNNRQNDELTFRLATEYDLWFHTQEIPGSHVLLRLDPGSVADDADLQYAADLAAYYSRARQSDQAPVIYTEPQHIYKPKGAKPGMVIYKQETVVWGHPRQAETYAPTTSTLP